MRFFLRLSLIVLLVISPGELSFAQIRRPAADQPASQKQLELSRPARPWEFLSSVGKKAGLLGSENGVVEAWVYPLKIFRDLRIIILHEGREIPAESLVRTVIARPETTTLLYAGDTFSIRET